MNDKKKRPMWEYVFAALLLFAILKVFGDRSSNVSSYTPEHTNEKSEPTEDLLYVEHSRNETELRQVVSEITPFSYMESNGDTVVIEVFLQEELDASISKAKAKRFLARLLEALKKTQVSYNKLRVTVYHPLIDVYGNKDVGRVVLAGYSKETIDKINFSGFSSDDVYRISDDHWINPVFKD